MIEFTACPSCSHPELERVGFSRYSRQGDSGSPDPGRQWADRAQRELVFTAWLPGRDTVELVEVLCPACGLVCFSPRPTHEDIARKYRQLLMEGMTPGTGGGELTGESRRAQDLHRRLRPHLASRSPRVLDVGGGDGRVLTSLRDAGAACFVVDYAAEQIPGVVRLGETLDDLAPGAAFDAVVVSHVLEHVAAPDQILAQARDRAPLVYAEVPVEIWRGTPIAVDPVIHVNYFVRRSLEGLLTRNGYRVLTSAEQFSFYRGGPLEIAWAVAVAGEGDGDATGAAAADVRARLRPSLAGRVRRRQRWAWFRGSRRVRDRWA